ncbi:hypothetical protein [Alkaliphilus peptidifermentans]|uniref:Uncharacterized protein n=1 Tax=Alkaliphilus peptidifermentans DSM 18978 TaxID=1120976 RepID=A0A1G5BZS6_9FIRM|nr:hypothetical protein [Alkaliphilus peptidifermentans]SCX95641.1 hypothetical protein SAMN03080606_00574 [Alkaliphilus peptidifermentans DSM 18978]
MKKYIFVPILLVIAFFNFLLFNFFFHTPNALKTFQHFTSVNYKIPLQLLEDLQGEKGEMAKEIIIDTTLTTIEYNKWKDYINYIDMYTYVEKVLPGDDEELIVVLNLSKDISVAVIFVLVGNEYVYHSHIENLVPVEKVEFLSFPSHDYKMMIIYQVLDERFGGFFYEAFLDIYCYISDDFKKTWQKTLYYEEVFNDGWINPEGKESLWNKVIEDTAIDFTSNGLVKVNTITTLSKYTAESKTFPKENDFSLSEKKSYQQSYYWSDEYNYFILGELTQSEFISKAGIVEDMEISINVFYNIENSNYKMISPIGEIFYLQKKRFKGMFETLFQ